MAVLPAEGEITWADLEAAYVTRGRQLVECDLARRLAVDALDAWAAKSAGRRAISAGPRGPEA